MTPIQRASWLVAAVVTLVAFGIGIPLLPALGPDTRHLSSDTAIGLTTSTVTIPSGWDIDIAAASQRQPVASLGDVRVSVTDAIWLGASRRLVEHTADLVFTDAPVLPDVPEAAEGSERETWDIVPGADAPQSDPRRVVVIRLDTSVTLVIVRGPDADVAAEADAIDAVIASVSIEAGPSLDVEAAA